MSQSTILILGYIGTVLLALHIVGGAGRLGAILFFICLTPFAGTLRPHIERAVNNVKTGEKKEYNLNLKIKIMAFPILLTIIVGGILYLPFGIIWFAATVIKSIDGVFALVLWKLVTPYQSIYEHLLGETFDKAGAEVTGEQVGAFAKNPRNYLFSVTGFIGVTLITIALIAQILSI